MDVVCLIRYIKAADISTKLFHLHTGLIIT